MKKIICLSDSVKTNPFLFQDTNGQILKLIFYFYKKYISSQDAVKCAFIPSCSEYSVQSIHHNGLFVGILDSFDRLSRCHTFSRDKYEIDPKTKLFIDPVK
jgi:putative component of membrane protein insertase Oxa1/YidC/SpoIIIJ protein YidD